MNRLIWARANSHRSKLHSRTMTSHFTNISAVTPQTPIGPFFSNGRTVISRGRIDSDTNLVSITDRMTDVTSKMLHENTGRLLDRARRGERFRILRDGQPDAYLLPPSEGLDPEWPEIMAEVWKAQKSPDKSQPNPILKERKSRRYAARVR